ncbi:arginase family protein [Macrococcus caseolyticus]|uniref:arginase family protein n=1 Tax=Macrococcoides caseolyticum TaxID=69966 RepID=UPI0024BD4E3A|nr:arginase family protein [Macrococcus caseolyticus]MDJ1110517.1 arginase family protein [Macrococcus caseolyticus]
MYDNYTLNSNLIITNKDEDNVCIFNNSNFSEVIIPSILFDILTNLSPSINHDTLFSHINNETFISLLSNNIIIPTGSHNIFKFGLLNEKKGISSLSKPLSILEFEDPRKWGIIGIDTYSNNDNGDLLMKPATNIIRKCLKMYEKADTKEFIIDTNRKKILKSKEVLPYDLGDILINNNYENIQNLNDKIAFICETLFSLKMVPIFLGGGHDISYYLIKNIISSTGKDINVIHFDAHTDRYDNSNNITRGNFMNHVANLEQVKEIKHIGIREFETKNNTISFNNIITSFELYLKNYNEVSFTSNDLPIYITFDADIFDPILAREVNYPVMGGPHYYDIFTIFEYICSRYNVIGADFVECFENNEKYNYTASLISNMITLLLNEGRTLYE